MLNKISGSNRNEFIKIDKNVEEITKAIFCRLQFIDCARFKERLLSNLVNNLAEG